MQVARRVACKLRLAAALGGDKTEGDHLTLPIVKAGACIVVAKAVARQPAVDVAALLRAAGRRTAVTFAKQLHLFVLPLLDPVLRRGGGLTGQRQADAAGHQHFIDDVQKGITASDAEISRGLINDLLDFYRGDAGIQRLREQFPEQFPALASQQYS